MITRFHLLLVAATAGAAVLALEVLAARALAPVLGSGPVAWAALLSVALGALSLGNLAGGLAADRVDAGGVIAWSFAVAAAALAALSGIYESALDYAAGAGLLAGSLLGAAITQVVPMVALGFLTPVLVRKGRGAWTGAVLAAGSAGGIAGALAAGLWLLPGLGTPRSLLAVAGLLVLAAFPSVLAGRRWVAGAVLVATAAVGAFLWSGDPDPNIVESRHGRIEVLDLDGTKLLLVDGLPQTAMPPDVTPGDALRHGYLLEVALMIGGRPEKALVVGLGAGLAPRVLAVHGVDVESVEVDPMVVEVARREFGFEGGVTVADGRRFLAAADGRWNLIVLDVCTADRLPLHLFTREALSLVRERLAPGGLLAMQFIAGEGRFAASAARTAREVFGASLVLAPVLDIAPVGPRWLFAGPVPTAEAMIAAEGPWRVVEPEEAGDLLTDDHFPPEREWALVAALWRRAYGF